jgi:hypothetical protein
MAIKGKIRTPKGKFVTVKQYVALANRNDQPCEHGHFGCAAWEHGPCSDELLSALEGDENFFITNERD